MSEIIQNAEWLKDAPPYVVLVFLVVAGMWFWRAERSLDRELVREIHGESVDAIKEQTRSNQNVARELSRVVTLAAQQRHA